MLISKSSIKIKQQVIFVKDNKFFFLENIGYFTSENETDKDISKSKHKGYLKVQKDDGFLHKYTDAFSNVSKDKMEGDSIYDEVHEKKTY